MRLLYMIAIIVVTLSCATTHINNIKISKKNLYEQKIESKNSLLNEWYEVIDGNVVYMNYEINILTKYKKDLISQKEKTNELDFNKIQAITNLINIIDNQIYQNRKNNQPVFQRSFQSDINDQIFYCKHFPKMAHSPCSVLEIEK